MLNDEQNRYPELFHYGRPRSKRLRDIIDRFNTFSATGNSITTARRLNRTSGEAVIKNTSRISRRIGAADIASADIILSDHSPKPDRHHCYSNTKKTQKQTAIEMFNTRYNINMHAYVS